MPNKTNKQKKPKTNQTKPNQTNKKKTHKNKQTTTTKQTKKPSSTGSRKAELAHVGMQAQS